MHATFTKAVSRADIEQALDAGTLMVRMRNGNNWRVRRNGQTQTRVNPELVEGADDFRIPCKAGLRLTFQITQADLPTFPLHFVIGE